MSEEEKKENLTSEDYRQKADEHMDALKNEWSVFGKTGIIILAALFAIIIIGFAWFASNREVSGTGMLVQSADGSFLLATLGNETQDDVLRSVHKAIVGSNSELAYVTPAAVSIENESKSGTVTSNSSPQINWALVDTSSDSTGSNLGNAGANKGLAPGSSGSLVFYVVPQDNTELNLTFQLKLTGYCETTDSEGTIDVTTATPTFKIKPVADDINKLISGHILFFQSKTSKGLYSKWLKPDENGKFGFNWSIPTSETSGETMETTTINGKTAYKVTLYWVWPSVFGQNLFPADSSGRYPAEFDDAVREQLKWDMMGLTSSSDWKGDVAKNGAPSKKYFTESSSTESGASSNMSTVITKETLDSFYNGTYNPVIYNNACVFYNAADQNIGNGADYLFLQLTAEKN